MFAKSIALSTASKRLELLNNNSVIPVYEVSALRKKKQNQFSIHCICILARRIVTAFEPCFFWRNRKFLKWYKDVFDTVDEVIKLPAASYGKKRKTN